MFIEEGAFNLEIYDTELADSGIYSCVVKNELGSVKSQCRLIIEGRKKMLFKYFIE